MHMAVWGVRPWVLSDTRHASNNEHATALKAVGNSFEQGRVLSGTFLLVLAGGAIAAWTPPAPPARAGG
eukprot:15466934-Alexandrium_andersonii.AAC.1